MYAQVYWIKIKSDKSVAFNLRREKKEDEKDDQKEEKMTQKMMKIMIMKTKKKKKMGMIITLNHFLSIIFYLHLVPLHCIHLPFVNKFKSINLILQYLQC